VIFWVPGSVSCRFLQWIVNGLSAVAVTGHPDDDLDAIWHWLERRPCRFHRAGFGRTVSTCRGNG